MRGRRQVGTACVLLGLAPFGGGSARAATAPSVPDQWLPNLPSASWTYGWSDDRYSKSLTYERYTVNKRNAAGVELAWTSQDAAGTSDPYAVPNQGTMDYAYSDSGVVNTNWSSTAPPVLFPVLCAQATQCGNSLASTHYMLIWGSRSPVLQEPLLAGATWTSLGGQGNDVASKNRYAGVERVVVPAFPRGIFAAKVVSDITQAGAIGDPYGSGQRTVWWVYGVGPVKIVFGHAGGEISQAQLYSTNLVPKTAPSDRAWLPLQQGDVMRFSYRNTRYMKQTSRQQFTVGAVANSTSRIDVQDLAGPIRVRGSYVFSSGLSGVRNLTVSASAATRVKFPPLGPRSLPSNLRRRFFTPLDLMTYGFNPVIPAFPVKGEKWRSSKRGRDFAVFGVTGTTRVIGFQRVTTPAGRFRALLVESKLRQKGFRFGSGTRRSWFAAGIGLVKLQFRHADGSVSTVLRLH